MPCAGSDIKHPGLVGGRKGQHVKTVPVLLVRVRDRIADVAVSLDVPLDRVCADPLALIAVGPIDDALAARVFSQPEHAVVHLGNRERCRAAEFVERALYALQRKVQRA